MLPVRGSVCCIFPVCVIATEGVCSFCIFRKFKIMDGQIIMGLRCTLFSSSVFVKAPILLLI